MILLTYRSALVLPALIPFAVQAQTGWGTSGNALSAGQFLGSTNAQAFVLKTNNTERFSISASGTFKFGSLSGTGNGLVLLGSDGTASRLNFPGSSTVFLTGAGTFSSITGLTGWTVPAAGITATTNKVGIGVSSPANAFEVNGNGLFSGYVAAQQFLVADMATVQGHLSLTNNMYLDGYDPVTGTRNEVYTTTQPYFIQSAVGYNNNTIVNFDNTGFVGIGTSSPAAKLHLAGDMIAEGRSRFYRITCLPGDTVLRFGDSTILMNTMTNTIYGSPSASPFVVNKGLGLGSFAANGKGQYAVAIGYQSSAMSSYSYSMGYYVKSNAAKAIAIGTGANSANYLTNDTENSLAIGFNSNLPTFFVSAAAGAGTTGNVGIGTVCTPHKLTVEGTVGAREVRVKANSWCDYVFAPGYQRLSLAELKIFIDQHKHLPNIPSEQEVVEAGEFSLADQTRLHLEKIEELTLYLIELNKKLDETNKRLEQLEQENAARKKH